jgi:hypothetical protein
VTSWWCPRPPTRGRLRLFFIVLVTTPCACGGGCATCFVGASFVRWCPNTIHFCGWWGCFPFLLPLGRHRSIGRRTRSNAMREDPPSGHPSSSRLQGAARAVKIELPSVIPLSSMQLSLTAIFQNLTQQAQHTAPCCPQSLCWAVGAASLA